MHKLDGMMEEIPMYSKKDQLNTLRNKCEHPIWRMLVYLASSRSKQGGTEQGTVCHRGMVPEKNSKSEQQFFYVGKK